MDRNSVVNDDEGGTKGEGRSAFLGAALGALGVVLTFGPFLVEERAMIFVKKAMTSSSYSTGLHQNCVKV